MQIKLIIDEKIEETEIQIHANTFTDEIEQIMKFLNPQKQKSLMGI